MPFLIPKSRGRPADIYLPHWNRGQPAVLDFTVISTMQQLTVRGAADSQGNALMLGDPIQRLLAQSVFPSSQWWLRPWGLECVTEGGHFTSQRYFPFVSMSLPVFMERES